MNSIYNNGMTRARIAVDAMGGDRAPDEIVLGAIRAAEELDVEIILVGDPDPIQSFLDRHKSSGSIKVVKAEEVVTMDDESIAAIRGKRKASINVAMKLVKQKEADAVVSAGHSGAAMVAASFGLGRLRGIDRPAIGAVFPTKMAEKSVIVLDVGANVDSRPKYLEQFALMGTIYSRYVMDVAEPKIGLLNIGEESSKGDELAVKSYQLLQENEAIPFVGNAEGKDVLSGHFDVIVCDGFTGNVLLKFAEAVGDVLLQILKEELPRGVRGKLGAAILEPNLKRIKERVDRAEHGGALLLGVAGVCIISHGSSEAPSIFNAIRLAKEAVDNKVLERIQTYNDEHNNRSTNGPKTASTSSGES